MTLSSTYDINNHNSGVKVIFVYPNKQRNRKIGKGVASTYGAKDTCPSTCPLLKSGACYGKMGVTNLHFKEKSSKNTNKELIAFIQSLPLNSIIRHTITGDFCRKNKSIDRKHVNSLIEGHIRRPDVKGWTYTHAWRKFKKNPFKDTPNLNVIASCETLKDIKEAKEKGFNTAIVAKENSTVETMLDGIKICLHTLSKGKITCSKCRLCLKKDYPYTIAFPLHGAGKRNFEASV